MRIAVVSDIHGNLTALEAVLADLRQVGADLVVQGGDLVGSGSRPAEVIDRIRDLRWPGVFGNSDEMLWKPDRIADVLGAPQFDRLRDMLLTEIIPSTHETIGPNRLAWLRALPIRFSAGAVTVVHAGPDDAWRSPAPNALDEELERAYAALASRFVVYGHVHVSFVRRLPSFTVANSGSVSLSYDGDPRAAYAVIDNDEVAIRRVEYDVEEEISRLKAARYPEAAWIAEILRKARYVPMPVDQRV